MYVEIQAIGRPHVSLPDTAKQGLECAAQWLKDGGFSSRQVDVSHFP